MKRTEMLFCKCIRLSSHPEELPTFTRADCSEITEMLSHFHKLAQTHSLVSSLYESLCLLDIPMSPEERTAWRQEVTGNALSGYHMLAFTRKILHILEQTHIRYFLLKGVTVLDCFPKLEFRSFGDVDILVPDSGDFKRLTDALLAQGFYTENSFSEHHVEMYCCLEGQNFLLEIHHRVIARQTNAEFNRKVKDIFLQISPTAGTYPAAGLSYQKLPVTEEALYLLLHMLQHFLGSGFGIRLLWDWTSFLENRGTEIDGRAFASYLQQLGLTKFCYAMTALCHSFLGLSVENLPFSTESSWDREFLEALMKDIVEAGTFGKADHARMLIMSDGGKLSQYFMELHRQMKKRFQTLGHIIPLWPFLWMISCFCFLWNNHFLRRTKTRKILTTARKRQELVKELKLFQKGGGTDES